jgi:DNA-binding CsgD family transcriptional regulator
MIDKNTEAKIIKLRAEGKSYATIAKKLHIAKQTAIDYCKENEEAIATLKAAELEALYEECRINKEARLKALSSLRDKLQTAIESRDFSDVTTDKLASLLLQTEAAIKDEAIEPRFLSSEEQRRDKRERETLDALSGI